MRRALRLGCTAGLLLLSCRPAETPATIAIHLVDLYRAEMLHGTAASPPAARVERRFDGPPGDDPSAKLTATRGWEAGPGVAGLAVRAGRLAGRTSADFPLLHLERPLDASERDSVTALEVRLRASAGTLVAVDWSPDAEVDLAKVLAGAHAWPWSTTAALAPGGEPQTVTLRLARPLAASEFRHLFLRPTDAAGAEFEIESVRLVLRREELAAIPSGLSWQGLSQIYRETLVARSPEEIVVPLAVPKGALLDLAVGTVEEGPVRFRVMVRELENEVGKAAVVLERTVTTPHRWDPIVVDLAAYAGRSVRVSLALAAATSGRLGFWGAPTVRIRTAPALSGDTASAGPPQGVILIWADTLRRDHLSSYGYARETSPVIDGLAAGGVRFARCVSPATWTKVATPSLLTSLYPSTHGVLDFSDRVPASATTLAEVFRSAGFATLSMSSILFTGQFTNLHQGFEELHEDLSLPDRNSSKTARIYVDRLLPWLESHRQVPFFVFLHLSDAHDPYEPVAPYNALWSDPAGKAEHQRQDTAAQKVIADPLLKAFHMPSRADLERAGIDADAFVDYNRGWYDGSIRAMDAEIGRLVERLRALDLERRTLLVFIGDHGEEFLEHGRSFHGQSTYGELANVPLIFSRPGALPAGRVVEETVGTVDILPTVLDLGRLPVPEPAQGTSLRPLQAAEVGAWRSRPAFTERHVTKEPVGAPPPMDVEAFAIVDGAWKLIHNTVRPRGGPEFELYDAVADPLNLDDVAAANPEVVARLAQQLATWRAKVTAARLAKDPGPNELSPAALARLRSLGYVH